MEFTILILGLSTLFSSFCYCQSAAEDWHNRELDNGIKYGHLIVEGTSTGISNTYNIEGKAYTGTVYQLTQLFRGDTEHSFVEVLAYGGRLGKFIEGSSHPIRVQAKKGESGILFLDTLNKPKIVGRLGHPLLYAVDDVLYTHSSSNRSDLSSKSVELLTYQALEERIGQPRRFIQLTTNYVFGDDTDYATVTPWPLQDTAVIVKLKPTRLRTSTHEKLAEISVSVEAINAIIQPRRLEFEINYNPDAFEPTDFSANLIPKNSVERSSKTALLVPSHHSFLLQGSYEIVKPGSILVKLKLPESKYYSQLKPGQPKQLLNVAFTIVNDLTIPRPRLINLEGDYFQESKRKEATLFVYSAHRGLSGLLPAEAYLTPIFDTLTSSLDSNLKRVYTVSGHHLYKYTHVMTPVCSATGKKQKLPVLIEDIISHNSTQIKFQLPEKIAGRSASGRHFSGAPCNGEVYLANGSIEDSLSSRKSHPIMVDQ